jgi:hypothetical protein
MKISIKFLMMALVLGVCTVACSKDDEKLPLAHAAGTYSGKLIVAGVDTIPNATIEVAVLVGENATLTIPANTITAFPAPIPVPCKITSDKNQYSVSGKFELPLSSEAKASIEIKSGTIKAGVMDLEIDVTLPESMRPEGVPGVLNIKYQGAQSKPDKK